MEIPKAVKNFELPQAVKNIELPAAMKNIELPTAVKNMELPAAVKNLELPAAVKNIELPEAVKNIDIQNVVKNVPNVVKNVPSAVMNNVPDAVKSMHVPINLNTNMFSSFASSAFTGVASLTKTIQQKMEETTRELQVQHEEFVKEIKEEAQEPKAGTVSEPTFWRNYFYRISLIKQTALESMKDNASEMEVYTEKTEKSENISEINEKQTETIKNKEGELSNNEVSFDASKSGDSSDSWVDNAVELEGLEDDDAEEPENWEEQLKEFSDL
ncbi:208_t:CDS:2 [Acaulospora colombiana]|uniref:208_t:CDS:1 n=1 Tax=Acaulospora colombiana TaxID=27376 RepID=A0ACA9JVQ5_9GLOM|nr:208_t:CDS:2 [Acaulospora colombiana]